MKGVALTFDDGPHAVCTPELLDRLARHRARATFFVIAPLAAAHPELLARMLADGHSVGLHCDTHVHHSERDRAWLEADTERALGRLAQVGVTPRLWRTPWGDTAPWTAEVAQRHGLRLVHWTVDTHDWRGDPADEMFAATRRRLTPGAVVRAHDGLGPCARRENTAETIAYVELVARYAGLRQIPLEALE